MRSDRFFSCGRLADEAMSWHFIGQAVQVWLSQNGDESPWHVGGACCVSGRGVGACWGRDEGNVNADRGRHESHKRISVFVWDTSSRRRVPRTST